MEHRNIKTGRKINFRSKQEIIRLLKEFEIIRDSTSVRYFSRMCQKAYITLPNALISSQMVKVSIGRLRIKRRTYTKTDPCERYKYLRFYLLNSRFQIKNKDYCTR